MELLFQFQQPELNRAAEYGYIQGDQKQADRDHPEVKYWQKTKHTADDQQDTGQGAKARL